MTMNTANLEKEIARAQRKAQAQQRERNIRHFESCHDRWRELSGFPPLIRRSDGRVAGVFNLKASR